MNNYEKILDGVRASARRMARDGRPRGDCPYARADFVHSWHYVYDAERKRMSEEQDAHAKE
jgi:hypothetical protein